MNTQADIVRVRREVLGRLLEEARSTPAIECCGLLAGCDGVVSRVLPARNALSSATAYEIAPADLFALFRHMRDERLEHLGIYHSHPHTDNVPSASDVERAYYPEAAQFILSPRLDAARPIRVFRIAIGHSRELKMERI
jgi:proteasome lid subunit RPN8/RPN11